MATPDLMQSNCLQRVGNVLAAPMDDELILLSIEESRYFGSGEAGKRIWELLESPRTIAELVLLLVQEYEVQPIECERDVIAFLKQLLDAKLVKIAF